MEIPLYYHLFYSFDSGKSKYPHDAARIKHKRSNFFQLNILPQKENEKKKKETGFLWHNKIYSTKVSI